jgi:hypothetical protein
LSRDCWERTLTLSQQENLLNLEVWYALVHDLLWCWCFVLFVDVSECCQILFHTWVLQLFMLDMIQYYLLKDSHIY